MITCLFKIPSAIFCDKQRFKKYNCRNVNYYVIIITYEGKRSFDTNCILLARNNRLTFILFSALHSCITRAKIVVRQNRYFIPTSTEAHA